jgi:hypothetical protein
LTVHGVGDAIHRAFSNAATVQTRYALKEATYEDAVAAWEGAYAAHRAALTAAEARGRKAERAQTVALIESLSEESKRQELDTQADQLTSIMYGGSVNAFARLLDELWAPETEGEE